MTRMRKGITTLAVVLLTVAPAAAQDRLVVLSPHPDGVKIEFSRAFGEHYRQQTGRDVTFDWMDVGGGTSAMLRYIRAQFKQNPGGIGVDLFFGGGTSPYLQLKREGLLAPHRVPDAILNQIAPQVGGVPLYDTDHHWYAATMSGFGIVYNRTVLERLGLPEPKTWADLARPEVFSWVASADPRKSGSVHMAYEIILQAYGWQKGWRLVTALGANVKNFSSGANRTIQEVANGEAAYGLAIDFYAWAAVRRHGPEGIGYVLPDDLTVINGDAMAILKGAPSRPIARRFVEFVLSEAGQKLWLLRRGEPDGPRKHELARLSVRPSLYPKVAGRTAVQVNPFQWQSSFVYDAKLGGTRWGIISDLIGTMVIDPHDRLAGAWQRAIDAGNTEAALDRLAAPPVTEAEVREWAARERWRKAEFRNRTINGWANLARQRYGSGPGLLQNLPIVVLLVLLVTSVIYIRRRC